MFTKANAAKIAGQDKELIQMIDGSKLDAVDYRKHIETIVSNNYTKTNKISEFPTAEILLKHVGDANRARIQTIDRKASAAEAAELAFRSCIGVMMPELLELWDDKNKRNQMHSKLWDDSKEEAIAGVTFDVLKRTAEELDQTVE
ncbi:unnamed protein product [Bathycoccus prasinos]